MLRNILCAGFVLTLSLGLAFAEPVKGKITSIDGSKITIITGAKKGEKGEKKTFDAAANVKVQKGMGNKTEPLAGGLKAAELQNIDAKKGVGAVLDVTGNTVNEITITAGKKK